MIEFPFVVPALRVRQPIGEFYVAVLPVELLLQVARSETAEAIMNNNGVGYRIEGTQRVINDRRMRQIADYLNRDDSTFPNSLILAANYDHDTGFDYDETSEIKSEYNENLDLNHNGVLLTKDWSVSEEKDGLVKLTIPTGAKLASIVDGQHRLFAFAYADLSKRSDMQLICSIFLDLPKPMQAQVFATINTTQKSVDRSVTYELFGYNIEDEDPSFWTPDKLAVFFTRKLATENSSPLRGRISVAPKRDYALQELISKKSWKVSTAVVVDGILRLISSNPKRDSNYLHNNQPKPRKSLEFASRDKTVLRNEYMDGNDVLIYTIVENFLICCNNLFWDSANESSFIYRSVGVLALFDILRKLVPISLDRKDISVGFFSSILSEACKIDFSEPVYRNTSGSGRSIIRRAIEEKFQM